MWNKLKKIQVTKYNVCEPGKSAWWHRALGSSLFGKQFKQIVLKGNFVTAHSLLMEVFCSRDFLSAWCIDRESRALLLTGLCQQCLHVTGCIWSFWRRAHVYYQPEPLSIALSANSCVWWPKRSHIGHLLSLYSCLSLGSRREALAHPMSKE